MFWCRALGFASVIVGSMRVEGLGFTAFGFGMFGIRILSLRLLGGFKGFGAVSMH